VRKFACVGCDGEKTRHRQDEFSRKFDARCSDVIADIGCVTKPLGMDYSALAWQLHCMSSTSVDRHTEWTVSLPFTRTTSCGSALGLPLSTFVHRYRLLPSPSPFPPSPSPSSTILPTPSDTHRHQYNTVLLLWVSIVLLHNNICNNYFSLSPLCWPARLCAPIIIV